ncbi:restriction endonuclease, partial [Cronobacter dublinensis]|uniref:restriction endonuclease n=1 Tax=Cronobacter dublinensis TaxID=413497 RepID=UPI000CFCDF34
FTDLDAPNKMDEKPFLEIDLLDIDENYIPELRKLTKAAFDIESIINTAGELKYVSQIKKLIASQFSAPEEEFVKFFASRVYEGMLTQKVKESFTLLTKKAATQFLNDQINERLKSAINPTSGVIPENQMQEEVDTQTPANIIENDILTTDEELEGYYIVKSIVRTILESSRITFRDTKSYFGILADDNNRKPICRLHFNRSQKYIGIFDNEKNETRFPLSTIDEIYTYSDLLRTTASQYSEN